MSRLCYKLHHLFRQLPMFNFPFEADQIPLNGIYVLFEVGELAHNTNRIVRIGTHTGNNQLRPRIEQHFVRENKDRSIFRKNIGRAILSRDKDPFLEQWELDLTTSEAKKKYAPLVDYNKQREIERRVTEYMLNYFRFIVFEMKDKDKRLEWESKIILTVSLCDECNPSSEWLGRYSPKVKIRQSGLWIVNELYKQPLSESEYEELKKLIHRNV